MQERRPTIDLKVPKAEQAAAGEGGVAPSARRGPIYIHRPKAGIAGPMDETQETTVTRVPGPTRASARREVLLRTLVRELPVQVAILAAGLIGLLALLVMAPASEGRGAAPTGPPLSRPVTEAPKPPDPRPALENAVPPPPATPRAAEPVNQPGATATVAGTEGSAGRSSELDDTLCRAIAAYRGEKFNVAATLFSELTQSPDPQFARQAKFMVDFLARRSANRGLP